MQCVRATYLGVGLAAGVGLAEAALGAGAAAEPAAPALLRLANLAAAPESARIGFAFTLEGPPLVDELKAGALTSLLPGPSSIGPHELWLVPRGLTLPKSLPEPLPFALPEVEGPGAAPFRSYTVFLFDRPGPRGEPMRQLVAGAAPTAPATSAAAPITPTASAALATPAAAPTGSPALATPAAMDAQLRVLNLAGGAELDLCTAAQSALTRAVPAWGLSRAPQWFARGRGDREAWTDVRTATAPPCRGKLLGALPLPQQGAFTIAVLAAADNDEAGLRALLLDEASLAPERAMPLPVRPPPQPSSNAKSAQSSVR